jgi:hypothetical protein
MRAKKWKLFIRDEGHRSLDDKQNPFLEGCDPVEYDSEEATLKAAWGIMYGPIRQSHRKVLYIDNGRLDRIRRDRNMVQGLFSAAALIAARTPARPASDWRHNGSPQGREISGGLLLKLVDASPSHL